MFDDDYGSCERCRYGKIFVGKTSRGATCSSPEVTDEVREIMFRANMNAELMALTCQKFNGGKPRIIDCTKEVNR